MTKNRIAKSFELETNILVAQQAIDELTAYLLSPKFHEDTTVQVKDVLNRLAPVRSALLGDQ